MLFNSLRFLWFFPAVVALYFVAPKRARWAVLLLASYFFYASWKPEYLFLLLFSTGVDYACGLRMAALPDRARRKPYLYLSFAANLGLLFAFKYYGFFAENLAALGLSLPASKLLLPVGVSFYTFQTLSYSVDVYWGRQEPERHLGRFALYVSFFPQLVAGPIERAGRLLPQFRHMPAFDYGKAVSGLRLMLWGFFKKIVVADRLAFFVDAAYSDPSGTEGGVLALATVLFAFQIYCDFSGYSDVAIGAARVMGFDLMENFRRPYFALSFSEFWRRWHISLSTWFRDYVYVPLGGNRVARWRWHYNLLATFLVSGLWHGAAWTFVVWGGLHGLCLLAERYLAPLASRARTAVGAPLWLARAASAGAVFALVCVAWAFFRAESLPDALTVLGKGLADYDRPVWTQLADWLGAAWRSPLNFLIALAALAFLLAAEWLAEFRPETAARLEASPFAPALYAVLAVVTLTLGVYVDSSQFIYFQF